MNKEPINLTSPPPLPAWAAYIVWGFLVFMLVVFCALMIGCGDDGGPGPDAGPPDAGPQVMNGESCDLDEGCEGGICLTEVLDGAIVFPKGMCTTDCSFDTDVMCVAGAESCIPVRAGYDEAYCLQICEHDEDCRQEDGYACLVLSPWEPPWCLPEELRRPWDDDSRVWDIPPVPLQIALP